MKKFLFIIISILLLVSFSFYTLNQQRWVAPKEADKIKNPITKNSGSIARGKAKYTQLCFVCHGTKGKGDGIGGMALKPRPANLTSSLVQSQTDGAIFWKISTGRPPMASYKEILTESQRWDVINYIRTLK